MREAFSSCLAEAASEAWREPNLDRQRSLALSRAQQLCERRGVAFDRALADHVISWFLAFATTRGGR